MDHLQMPAVVGTVGDRSLVLKNKPVPTLEILKHKLATEEKIPFDDRLLRSDTIRYLD